MFSYNFINENWTITAYKKCKWEKAADNATLSIEDWVSR